jgi:hypothetical protein
LYLWTLPGTITQYSWRAIVAVAIVHLSFEVFLWLLFVFKWRPRLTDEQVRLNSYATRERTMCIIPFQNVDRDTMVRGVDSAVNLFAEVYVLGEVKYRDELMEIVMRFNVHHFCFPSNITVTDAIYQTVRTLTLQKAALPFTIVTDGKTVFDDDFFVRADMFAADLYLAAYSPNIRTTTKVFDMEFVAASFYKSLSGFYHTADTTFPQCTIYRSDILLNGFFDSPTKSEHRYVANEDWIGQSFKLYDMRIGHDPKNLVFTSSPTFIGKTSTIRERIMVKHLNWLRMFFREFYLFVCYSTGFILCSIVYHIEWIRLELFHFAFILWPLMVVKSLATNISSWGFWLVMHIALYILGLITISVRSLFLRRFNLIGVLLYPLLMALDSLCWVASTLISIFWYIPFVRRWLRQPWKEGLEDVGDTSPEAVAALSTSEA